MSETLRAIYQQHYADMSTPMLWDEAEALFGDHNTVSADLSTRKYKLVIIELIRRGVVFEPAKYRIDGSQEVA